MHLWKKQIRLTALFPERLRLPTAHPTCSITDVISLTHHRMAGSVHLFHMTNPYGVIAVSVRFCYVSKLPVCAHYTVLSMWECRVCVCTIVWWTTGKATASCASEQSQIQSLRSDFKKTKLMPSSLTSFLSNFTHSSVMTFISFWHG